MGLGMGMKVDHFPFRAKSKRASAVLTRKSRYHASSKSGWQPSRNSSHRWALMRNLITALLREEKIQGPIPRLKNCAVGWKGLSP